MVLVRRVLIISAAVLAVPAVAAIVSVVVASIAGGFDRPMAAVMLAAGFFSVLAAAVLWVIAQWLPTHEPTRTIEAIPPELQFAVPRHVQLSRRAKVALGLIASVIVVVAALSIRERQKEAEVWRELLTNGVDTVATTTRRWRNSGGRSSPRYHVGYQYAVGGTTYSGSVQSRSLYETFKPKQRIWVVYSPQAPSISRFGRRGWIPRNRPERVRSGTMLLGVFWTVIGAGVMYRSWAYRSRLLDLARFGTPVVATVVKKMRVPPRFEIAFAGERQRELRQVRATPQLTAHVPVGSQVVALVSLTNPKETQLYSVIRRSLVVDEAIPEVTGIGLGPTAL